MEVPTLTRSWSMTAVFEPSHAGRAVTVAKRREYIYIQRRTHLPFGPLRSDIVNLKNDNQLTNSTQSGLQASPP